MDDLGAPFQETSIHVIFIYFPIIFFQAGTVTTSWAARAPPGSHLAFNTSWEIGMWVLGSKKAWENPKIVVNLIISLAYLGNVFSHPALVKSGLCQFLNVHLTVTTSAVSWTPGGCGTGIAASASVGILMACEPSLNTGKI